MGGSANIQGVKAQTLACLLEALNTENDWKSLILEPDFGNSKVDIEWHYENTVVLTQIKSSQNRFTANQVKKLAQEIEQQNPDCDSVVLTLVGNNSGNLQNNQQISGKTTVKLLALSFDDLRAVCSNKLDIYFHKNGTSVSPIRRDIFVSTLIDRLEDCAIKSSPVPRKEFTDWLDTLLEMKDLSYLKNENEEIKDFYDLFGIKETSRKLRTAVLDYYQKSSLRNLHLVIKDASDFLDYDEYGNLTVKIGLLQYSVYTIFLICEVGLFLLGTLLGILDMSYPPSKLSFLLRVIVLIIFAMTIPLMIATNPFIQALRIRYDISKRIF